MKRASNGRVARRCVTCLVALSVAAWALLALVDGSRNARAQVLAQERYESQLQHDFSRLPVGHVEEIFGRAR